ncbi:MAG: hypothetical protein LBF71_02705 [Campylobacteraceae bacterium]|nr:hypothetical protein [Campylobacteraceae bacterium]
MLYQRDKKHKNTQHRVMYEGTSGTHYSVKWYEVSKGQIVIKTTKKAVDIFRR